MAKHDSAKAFTHEAEAIQLKRYSLSKLLFHHFSQKVFCRSRELHCIIVGNWHYDNVCFNVFLLFLRKGWCHNISWQHQTIFYIDTFFVLLPFLFCRIGLLFVILLCPSAEILQWGAKKWLNVISLTGSSVCYKTDNMMIRNNTFLSWG